MTAHSPSLQPQKNPIAANPQPKIKPPLVVAFILFVAGSIGAPPSMPPAHAEAEIFALPHALSLHTPPKYKEEFTHFDYVNPNAPRGGTIRLAAFGNYDNFNHMTTKGQLASGIGLLYNSLMSASSDEIFTMYGELVERIELAEDRLSIRFTLRREAQWHDGVPLTADDVKFSFDMALTEPGIMPLEKRYYADITEIIVLEPNLIEFRFASPDNAELPLIIGQLPIIPKHFWEGRNLTETMLEPPLGSGPYRIANFSAGEHITYQRVENYWGENLPTATGFNNFDSYHYDYYKDRSVIVEAVKGGLIDIHTEGTARNWAVSYDIPAVERGALLKLSIPHNRTEGMQGFVYNTRRPVFADPAVREALAYAFDFEWANRILFYEQYKRQRSFFDNSELASLEELPTGEELALLESVREHIPNRVFTETYQPPTTTGGSLRKNLAHAARLLDEAGWTAENGIRSRNGTELRFEIMLVQPTFERIALPFASNLERIGVDVNVNTIPVPDYIRRLNEFDFDMVVSSFAQSDSPGNEQRDFWSSGAATTQGSRNLAGIVNPGIDDLIERIIVAPNRQAQLHATRALDRVLLWSFLVVPHWYIEYDRLVVWNRFGMPEQRPPSGAVISSWWIDAEKDDALQR